MVMDRLVNLQNYLPKSKMDKILPFLKNVSPRMEEGEYEIDGPEIFARVMSYDTMEKEQCAIEAHNQYVDIQFSLIGAEAIDVFQRDKLTVKHPYDVQNDVEFYDLKGAVPYVETRNLTGFFTMLFPQEAHRPKQKVDGFDAWVKKAVIKVKVGENE